MPLNASRIRDLAQEESQVPLTAEQARTVATAIVSASCQSVSVNTGT